MRYLYSTSHAPAPALQSSFLVNISVAGAYAGAGIQYIIPCSLVFLARKKLNQFDQELNLNLKNPLGSYFQHTGFIIMIVVWSVMAVGLVTANFIIGAVN